MAESVFYPNAHIETTSVDGTVQHDVAYDAGLSWAAIIAAGGSGFSDSVDGFSLTIKGSNEADKWMMLRKWILLFDTSPIPLTDVIVSATLEIYGYGKDDNLTILPNCNVYSSDPGSPTELANGDFDSLGAVAFCDTPIAYGDWDTDGMNSFVLNAAGLAAIAREGITKLGIRNANYDVAGVLPPNWANQQASNLYGYTADKGGDFRPKLTIIHSAVNVATVSTNEATDIDSTVGILNGTLDTDGGEACDCGFEWGLTVAYGDTTPTQSRTTGQTFSQVISELAPNTTYHFRAFATNVAGTGYGEDKVFTTLSGQDFVDQTIIGNKVSLEAIRNIEMAYGGRNYINKSGIWVYESRYHRNV